MRDELIVLDKRAFVEEKFNALSCSEFVIGVLLVNSGLSATHESFVFDFVQSLSKSLLLKS